MTEIIIEGTPYATQPPGTPSDIIIDVTTDVLHLQPSDIVSFVVSSDTYRLTDCTCEIRRRRNAATRNTDTDPIVETMAFVTDADGYMSLSWGPGTAAAQGYSGPMFRYYIKVYPTASPTVYVCTDQEFIIFSEVDVVLHDLELALGPVQSIPVYDEISKDSGVLEAPSIIGRRNFSFTWHNWRDDFTPVVFQINADAEAAVQPLLITYPTGVITFDDPVAPHIDVQASYVFRYYPRDDLNRFMNQALNQINYTRPETRYTLAGFPRAWSQLLVAGAAMHALEQLFLSQIFVERKLLFSQIDVSAQLTGYYNQLIAFINEALKQKNRWSLVSPRAISGHDLIAPPRITGQNFWTYAYLRGRGA